MITAEQKGVDHDTGQKQCILDHHRPARGDGDDQHECGQTARKGREAHSGDAGQPQGDADDGADGRTAGDAQDIGLGQRILQQGLEHQSPQGKGRPYECGKQHPGKAEAPDDGILHGVVGCVGKQHGPD